MRCKLGNMEYPLRLLVLSLEYPPPALGGYEVMCANVCQWLARQGHAVQVLTTSPQQARVSSEDARGADEIAGGLQTARNLTSIARRNASRNGC